MEVYYINGNHIGHLSNDTDTHYVVIDKDGETAYISKSLAEVREK